MTSQPSSNPTQQAHSTMALSGDALQAILAANSKANRRVSSDVGVGIGVAGKKRRTRENTPQQEAVASQERKH